MPWVALAPQSWKAMSQTPKAVSVRAAFGVLVLQRRDEQAHGEGSVARGECLQDQVLLQLGQLWTCAIWWRGEARKPSSRALSMSVK
ncbi:hypothetical protein [Streptomyces sp. NPDC052036]|uniref:hypothetical protein n=1 Tax=Streptomyces sp. NPDC052036 TaxID=3155171 RepID=UPI0034362DD8